MIFPNAPTGLPRHPSQIYQALMEGLLLFLLVFAFSRVARVRERFGFLTGVFPGRLWRCAHYRRILSRA